MSGLSSLVQHMTGTDSAGIERHEPREGYIMRYFADFSRARRALGFAPGVSLTNGLRALIDQKREAQPN